MVKRLPPGVCDRESRFTFFIVSTFASANSAEAFSTLAISQSKVGLKILMP